MIYLDDNLVEEIGSLNAGITTLHRTVQQRAVDEYHWHLMEAARLLDNAKYMLRRATTHLNDYEANPGSDNGEWR